MMPRRLFPRLVLLLGGALVLTTAIGLIGLFVTTRSAATQYAARSFETKIFVADNLLAQSDRVAAEAHLRALGIEHRRDAPGTASPPLPFHQRMLADLYPLLPGRSVRVVEQPRPMLWIAAPQAADGWIGLPLLSLRASLRWSTALWLIAGLVVVFGAAGWYANSLVRPLADLARAAPALIAGESAPPLPAGSARELIELAQSFERAAADTRAAAQERQLLLAGLSHDMRTPLARLVVALELLDGGDDRIIRAGMASDIAELDAILDQFIAFVRDGRDENAATIDVGGLLDDALAAQRRGGRDWQRLGVDRAPLYAKPLALRRALDNLLENAVRHGAAPFEAELGAAAGAVMLSIRDRGPGAAGETLHQLGKPFYRADSARSSPGSGLGLATVARIAAWHDGGLVLRNRDGGGFEARLRLVAARA